MPIGKGFHLIDSVANHRNLEIRGAIRDSVQQGNKSLL